MQRVWCNMWFICNCISAFYGFVKRIVFKFRKKKIDEDLPRTSSVNHSVLPNDNTDLEWDDWGDGAPTSIRIEQSNEPVAMQNDMGVAPIQPANAHMLPGHGHAPPTQMTAAPDEPEEEEEIDYFADMTPKLKKPVLIRKKVAQRQPVESNSTAGMALSSRLTMSVDPSILPTSELSTWDDSANTWEDEAGAVDLSWEAEQVIREKKQADREKRAAEQQRRKMEREAQRAMKKDSSKLAVKLK